MERPFDEISAARWLLSKNISHTGVLRICGCPCDGPQAKVDVGSSSFLNVMDIISPII